MPNVASHACPPGTVDFDSARTTYHPAAEHATSAAVVGAPSGAASVPEDSRDDDLPGMQLPPFGSTASTAASAATPTAVAPPAALPAPPVEGADAGGLGVNARPPEEGAGGSGVAGLPGVGLGAGAGTAGEVGASGSSGTGTGGATAASAISCWFHIFTELQRRRGAIPGGAGKLGPLHAWDLRPCYAASCEVLLAAYVVSLMKEICEL